MKEQQRLRLDISDRAEGPPNGECADLRLAILEANERGDVDRLAQLRSEYRVAAHHGGGDGQGSPPGTPVPRVGLARHTARSQAHPVPIRRPKTQQEIDRDLEEFEAEEKRAIYCTVARFGVPIPQRAEDGSTHYISLQPTAVDKWLREHDPSEVAFTIDHQAAPARWTSLWASNGRLWGRAVADEGFEDLVELAGIVAGCSIGGDVVHSTDRADHEGLAAFDVHELTLRDAGLATESPADPECRVRSCGGGPPWARHLEQQHERHLKLAASGILRPAGNATPWRARFNA